MGRLLVLSVVIFITSCYFSFCGDLKNVWMVNGENFQTISLVYSADGAKLFAHCSIQDSLGNRYVIQQWDVQTQKLEKDIPCPMNFSQMIVSDDYKTLIGTNDQTLLSFDLTTGEAEEIYYEHDKTIYCLSFLSFSKDGSKINIYNAYSEKIQVLDAQTYNIIDSINIGFIRTVIISPNKQIAGVFNYRDSILSIWNFENKTILKNIQLKKSRIYSASISFDNKYVAVTYPVKDTIDDIEIYSIEDGNLFKSYSSGQPRFKYQSTAFLSDSKSLITGNEYTNEVSIYNMLTDEHQKMDFVLSGSSIQVSPKNNQFAGINNFNILEHYSDNYSLLFNNFPDYMKQLSYISSIVLTKFEQVVYAAGSFWGKGYIQKRKLMTGELIKNFEIAPSALLSCYLSKDEAKIAVSDNSGYVYILDNQPDTLIIEKKYKFDKPIKNVILTQDNNSLFATENNLGVILINLATDSIRVIDSTRTYFNTMALSSDEVTLIYGTRESTFGLIQRYSNSNEYFKIGEYDFLNSFTTSSGINEIGFSPDNTMIYFCNSNYCLYILDAVSFAVLKDIAVKTGYSCNVINTASLTSDNSMILLFDGARNCRIFDIKTNPNYEIWRYDSLSTEFKVTRDVNTTKFCNNDNYFIISCDDGSIGVFDIKDITDVDELTLHNENINVYPNPAGETITIDLCLNKSENVEIEIIALNGSLIKSIFNGYMPEGNQKIEWNCGEIANGIYFCKVSSNSFSGIKKIVVGR